MHVPCGFADESRIQDVWCPSCHEKENAISNDPTPTNPPPPNDEPSTASNNRLEDGVSGRNEKEVDSNPKKLDSKQKKAAPKKKKPKKNLVDTPADIVVDSLISTRVAFCLDGPRAIQVFGNAETIASLVGYSKFIRGKRYIFGVITKRNTKKSTKSKSVYEVQWEDTRIGSTNMDSNYFFGAEGGIPTAMKLQKFQMASNPPRGMYAVDPKTLKEMEEAPVFEEYFQDATSALDSDAEGSDGESLAPSETILPVPELIPDDLDENFMFQSLQHGMTSDSCNETVDDGLEWQFGGTVDTPVSFATGLKSRLNTRGIRSFTTPLASFLSFFPIELWKLFVQRTNEYAAWCCAAKQGGNAALKFPSWSGDTNLKEFMLFISILMEMTLSPEPGRPFDREWTYGEMTLRRFKELRAAMCVSKKGSTAELRSKDALFKVRPLLNTLKKTLNLYLDVGTDLALDESSVACRSKYGRNCIFFNNTKPSGKYHFRFYLLCEADFYNCLRIVVATKSGSDCADGYVEAAEESDEEDADNVIVQAGNDNVDEEDIPYGEKQNYTKTTRLVLDICQCLKGMGRVVNTDNYYTSPQVAIALKSQGIFMRGTCRKSRRMFPKTVTWEKTEAKSAGRGKLKVAVNKDHGLIALGWTDGNPVHFLSSVDGNSLTSVTRRVGLEQTSVRAPVAIKKFNKGMQGVDRFDQLMSLYSLASRHGFKKWYKKMMMALLDVGLVNTEQHYWMAHPQEKKQTDCHRYRFRVRLVNELRQHDWEKYAIQPSCAGDSVASPPPSYVDPQDESPSTLGNSDISRTKGSSCEFVLASDYFKSVKNPTKGSRSYTGLVCQVCVFEFRGKKTRDVMYCTSHGIRACYRSRDASDCVGDDAKQKQDLIKESSESELSWLCPNKEWTCWQKLHDFYLPRGLWASNFKRPTDGDKKKLPTRKVSISSDIYKEREKWMVRKQLKVRKNKSPGPARKNLANREAENPSNFDDNDSLDNEDEPGKQPDRENTGDSATEEEDNNDGKKREHEDDTDDEKDDTEDEEKIDTEDEEKNEDKNDDEVGGEDEDDSDDGNEPGDGQFVRNLLQQASSQVADI